MRCLRQEAYYATLALNWPISLSLWKGLLAKQGSKGKVKRKWTYIEQTINIVQSKLNFNLTQQNLMYISSQNFNSTGFTKLSNIWQPTLLEMYYLDLTTTIFLWSKVKLNLSQICNAVQETLQWSVALYLCDHAPSENGHQAGWTPSRLCFMYVTYNDCFLNSFSCLYWLPIPHLPPLCNWVKNLFPSQMGSGFLMDTSIISTTTHNPQPMTHGPQPQPTTHDPQPPQKK